MPGGEHRLYVVLAYKPMELSPIIVERNNPFGWISEYCDELASQTGGELVAYMATEKVMLRWVDSGVIAFFIVRENTQPILPICLHGPSQRRAAGLWDVDMNDS